MLSVPNEVLHSLLTACGGRGVLIMEAEKGNFPVFRRVWSTSLNSAEQLTSALFCHPLHRAEQTSASIPDDELEHHILLKNSNTSLTTLNIIMMG